MFGGPSPLGSIGTFETLTFTGGDVPRFPDGSRPTAVSVCVPFVTVRVFQLTEYGARSWQVELVGPVLVEAIAEAAPALARKAATSSNAQPVDDPDSDPEGAADVD